MQETEAKGGCRPKNLELWIRELLRNQDVLANRTGGLSLCGERTSIATTPTEKLEMSFKIYEVSPNPLAVPLDRAK